jgi:hypothetical protein
MLDTAGMLALGRSLLHLAPTPPPQEISAPLNRLKQAWEELNSTALIPRSPGRTDGPAKQPVDIALDNAWTALYERLRAFSILSETELPQVRRAHDLMRLLFPDALAFLKLPYEQEWAESGSRLRLIERLKLTDEVNALAGAEFLTQVRHAHELYGKMLGIGGDSNGPAPAESPAMRDQRGALGRCISHYALRVMHIADENPVEARRLLAPLVEYHRLAERRPPTTARPSGDSKPSMSGDRWPAATRSGESGTFRAGAESGITRPAAESGTYRPVLDPPPHRVPSDPGPLRPIIDPGSNPHRPESGLFRAANKKPVP